MKDKHCRVCWKPSPTAWCEGCRKIREAIDNALKETHTTPLEDMLIRYRARGTLLPMRRKKKGSSRLS